jgi:hypothetical protein
MPGAAQRGAETQSEPQISQQENIASLAYALWQQRGCPQGSSEQDWLEAEQRLQEKQSAATAG